MSLSIWQIYIYKYTNIQTYKYTDLIQKGPCIICVSLSIWQRSVWGRQGRHYRQKTSRQQMFNVPPDIQMHKCTNIQIYKYADLGPSQGWHYRQVLVLDLVIFATNVYHTKKLMNIQIQIQIHMRIWIKHKNYFKYNLN